MFGISKSIKDPREFVGVGNLPWEWDKVELGWDVRMKVGLGVSKISRIWLVGGQIYLETGGPKWWGICSE